MSSFISLHRIDLYRKDAAVIGALKRNDRLWTWGHRMVRIVVKDQLFKEEKSPFLRSLNKVVNLAMRVILAIGELLTSQNVEKNIASVDTLTENALKILNDNLDSYEEPAYYKLLEGYGELERHMKSAASIGLKAYQESCLKGNLTLVSPRRQIRLKCALKIQAVRDKINQQLLPVLHARIQAMQQSIFQNDQQKVVKLIDDMINNKKLSGIALSKINVSAPAARNALEALYGKALVDRIFSFYRLNRNVTLNGFDIASLLIGIVTNVTMTDLKGIYELNPKWKVVDEKGVPLPFENFSESQLCTFLTQVRNINSDIALPSNCPHYVDQFKHDQRLLKTMKEYEEFNSEIESDKLKVKALRKYAYAEFLVRDLVYAFYNQSRVKFADGVLFYFYDKHHNLSLKQVTDITSHKGLYCALVRPAVISKTKDHTSLQLVFRGTYCKDSLWRDLAESTPFINGPGRSSFEKKQQDITKKLFSSSEEVVNSGLKLKLEVMGHSLGGSDSQRAVAYLASKVSEKKGQPFSAINLFAFNSPKVEKDVAKKFILNALKADIPFKLRYFDMERDAIKQVGVQRLGYCGPKIEKPHNLFVSIFNCHQKVSNETGAKSTKKTKEKKSNIAKTIEAHSSPMLKLHRPDDPKKYNATYIQDIFTNNPKDEGLPFGFDMKMESKMIAQNEMDSRLVTKRSVSTLARLERKRQKVMNAFRGSLSKALTVV